MNILNELLRTNNDLLNELSEDNSIFIEDYFGDIVHGFNFYRKYLKESMDKDYGKEIHININIYSDIIKEGLKIHSRIIKNIMEGK